MLALDIFLSCLLAPLPRLMVEPDITDAVLIAHVWAMEWGDDRQECHFWDDGQACYWSPQFGGGSFAVGRGGRVEFEEGSAKYVMVLRRTPEGLTGSGWRVYDDGTRGGEVDVRMKPKQVEMD